MCEKILLFLENDKKVVFRNYFIFEYTRFPAPERSLFTLSDDFFEIFQKPLS